MNYNDLSEHISTEIKALEDKKPRAQTLFDRHLENCYTCSNAVTIYDLCSEGYVLREWFIKIIEIRI